MHYITTTILYIPTEELQLQAEQKAAVDTEVEVLRSQVQQLQADLEEAHSAVTIAQCTAENDVAVEQRKCQEEIATVHQLMKGRDNVGLEVRKDKEGGSGWTRSADGVL